MLSSSGNGSGLSCQQHFKTLIICTYSCDDVEEAKEEITHKECRLSQKLYFMRKKKQIIHFIRVYVI